MFSGATRSACGFAQAAMGPFYCPNDRKVYLDTSFFQDLERRFRGCEVGSKGCQFSQAYVITHEIGHHVQNLLGILPKVQQMQHGLDQAEANQLQVRVELQADCLSGVWAHHAEEKWRLIEPGDVEAAMQTASAIGDDRLQRRSQGYVVPDAFTHGSSAQRTRWFLAGLKSGELASCDTFGAQQLWRHAAGAGAPIRDSHRRHEWTGDPFGPEARIRTAAPSVGGRHGHIDHSGALRRGGPAGSCGQKADAYTDRRRRRPARRLDRRHPHRVLSDVGRLRRPVHL